MQTSAWRNGGQTYGIRVGAENRNRYFDRAWREIEVDIDGRFYQFRITDGFWNRCPEFRDAGTPVIREWLRQNRTLNWQKGAPPQVELMPLQGNRFRLLA
jgi:hypothetical protein